MNIRILEKTLTLIDYENANALLEELLKRDFPLDRAVGMVYRQGVITANRDQRERRKKHFEQRKLEREVREQSSQPEATIGGEQENGE